MSRITELKKQNPGCNISLIDCLSLLFGKTKYVDLYLKFDKDYKAENPNFEEELDEFFKTNEIESILTIDDLSTYDKYVLYRYMSGVFNMETIKTMNTFIDLNERNLIEQNDITKYKNIDDMINQISLAQLKTIGKDLEKFIIKLRDDEEWLILKPLSWEASKKYGANTKWCTTSYDTDDYFYKYSKNGVLIYMINKKTGYKVASYNAKDEGISFWNQKDQRIDSMETLLPEDIKLFLMRHHTEEKLKPNFEYLSSEERDEIIKSRDISRPSLRVVAMGEPGYTQEEYPEDEIVFETRLPEILPSSTSPITRFPTRSGIIAVMSSPERSSSFGVILFNHHSFTFCGFTTKTEIYFNNFTFIVFNKYFEFFNVTLHNLTKLYLSSFIFRFT